MIDRHGLLSDLQKVLKTLETDLLERTNSADVPEIKEALRAEYDRARQAERTAQSYEEWKSDTVTQTAAAWVLSCVFVRFLEDNRLIDPPKIAGPSERLQRARDEYELYFRAHPRENDRDYLLAAFNELSKLPGTKDVFGGHNPVNELPNWLSGDAAGDLLRFFQKIDANAGALVHDFTDTHWDTRFLGDLYQDLSEAARKKYALLQTPEFVEEFILDRTLEPALDEFGLNAAPMKDVEDKPVAHAGFRMMDPACGSGHFLLGAFRRILNRWLRQEPGTKIRELVQRTLGSIHGVDLNPYAVAIARFRLLLASMQACGITRLSEAPAFELKLACGDSLLHGVLTQGFLGDWSPIEHHFHTEDIDSLRRLLMPGQYHAVVANPPYPTPKDKTLNRAYRERYSTCHKKYSLAVPFMERIFQLAIKAGFTGQITANSFMKREFGKPLIEKFLPKIDLTHIIDSSGAYIPGHGTPTVILFGRNRKPVAATIRTVMGIRSEPSTPSDPSQGLVWKAITSQIDEPNSRSEFVSVSDSPRDQFNKHPWSTGGGGAAELRLQLEESCTEHLADCIESIGFMSITGEDEIFVAPSHSWRRKMLPYRDFGIGEYVRDWLMETGGAVVFMYSVEDSRVVVTSIEDRYELARFFWSYRTNLRNRLMFGKLPEESGLQWYEYRFKSDERINAPFLIVFAFVATHNHFVLNRGERIFKQSAPVIALRASATENDYVGLLGLLNSSIACFWMQQVFHNKGRPGAEAAAADEPWEFRFEHDGTKLQQFPLPEFRPTELAHGMEILASELRKCMPETTVLEWTKLKTDRHLELRSLLEQSHQTYDQTRGRMIALQEELDWRSYEIYGLISGGNLSCSESPSLHPGERAFEIILARRCAAGEIRTAWFDRLSARPVVEIPSKWPESYRATVQARIALIESHPQIGLIEQCQFKRRWQADSWHSKFEHALREWLLGRLETYLDFDGRMSCERTTKLDMAVQSVSKLAELARLDSEFLEAGGLYRDDTSFDVHQLVSELVETESVPLLPVLRYKESGIGRRSEWERTWDLQRQEDAIEARTKLSIDAPQYLTEDQALALKKEEVGEIAVPPRYTIADFVKTDYWRLRGKLDVPKERWVSFPHCEGPDGTLVIAWAGYDHLQLARALSTYYVDIQERFGGRDDPRLVPLLACVIELLPWVKQWHNAPNPDFDGMKMGDYFEGFIQEETRQMGKTVAEIKAWQPPQRAKSKRTRA